MGERRNTDKVVAAVHYLIARLPAHRLGATKLNKILWFADCAFYARHGRSLTGETHYIRKPQGPYVARFESAITHLLLHKDITERRVKVIDYARQEFYPHSEPDVSIFTAEEIDVLINVAMEVSALTADKASERSHEVLWECTPPNAKMSVAAGAVRGQPLDEEDMEWARSTLTR